MKKSQFYLAHHQTEMMAGPLGGDIQQEVSENVKLTREAWPDDLRCKGRIIF